MRKVHLECCPLCGGKDLGRVMVCEDRFASHEEFEVVCCNRCGFRMTQDVPSEEEIGSYYIAQDYISHTDTKEGLMSRIYHRVRSLMLGQKAALIERELPKKGNLLDIGAGTGYFAAFMRERGWQVTAIEKSQDARKFAKEQFRLDILPSEAIEELPSSRYDAITLWHVLEHLEQLDHVWDRLMEMLRPEGRLVIAVPNHVSLDAAYYGSDWAAYDVPRHLWHFSPETLEAWAVKKGFVLTGCHRMVFDSFYVSMLTEKQKGRSLYFIRGLWTGFLSFLSALRNRRRCSSLIYVLKKK